MRSPLAKRFELPPTTTIGVVDGDNTISLAPPVQECLTPLKYTPKWTKGKSGFVSSQTNRNLSVPRGSTISPTFLITSPSLLNKALVRNQRELGEVPFVGNYHVPKPSQLQAMITASHLKQTAKLIGLSPEHQRTINAQNLKTSPSPLESQRPSFYQLLQKAPQQEQEAFYSAIQQTYRVKHDNKRFLDYITDKTKT